MAPSTTTGHYYLAGCIEDMRPVYSRTRLLNNDKADVTTGDGDIEGFIDPSGVNTGTTV